MKRSKLVFSLFSLILFVGFVFAIPSLPHVFIGDVEYSGNSKMSLIGYDISASIENYGLGVVGQVGDDNQYEIEIDPQGRTGEIYFFIGGVQAEETETYSWGGHTEDFRLTINEYPSQTLCGNGIQEPGEQCDDSELGIGTCENVLGIPESTGTLSCTKYCTFDYSNCSAPTCGDGTCNEGEDCSSCLADCGECPVETSEDSSSGGSSGGGGGGGSSGGSYYVPKENVSTNETEINLVGLSSDLNETEENSVEENEEFKQTFFRTTGSAISDFSKTKTGKGVIVVIGIVFVIGIFMFFSTKRKNKFKKN